MKKCGYKLKNLKSGIGLWRGLMASMVVGLLILLVIQAVQAATVTPAGISNMEENTVLQKSISHLQDKAQDRGIQNAQKEFRLKKINRDNLGQVHVRYDQVYEGIPVYGEQVIVHMNGDGVLLSVTGNYLPGIETQVIPGITSQEATKIASTRFSGSLNDNSKADLMLYPLENKVLLVYRVAIEDFSIPTSIVAFVDAKTGAIIEQYDNLQTPVAISDSKVKAEAGSSPQSPIQNSNPGASVFKIGIGKSLYSGTINIDTIFDKRTYSMVDRTKGIGSTDAGYLRTSDMRNGIFSSGTIFSDKDNIWGNFLNTDRATAGVDAHYGAGMTWDYYLDNFGRKGIFNDGKGTLSKVHYGSRYNNAFWDGVSMTYGDGDGVWFTPLVSLDVAGHEMTHGVTESVAGLVYTKQSGGINEAMSDIFGTMVEFYAAEHGASTTADYLVGEDIFTPGTPGDALRYMNDPTRDGSSIDTFSKYNDGIDVHYSSGIANNAFYLLAVGGTHRLGGVVDGIGKDKADKIFFRALDVYMVPTETFSQGRTDTIRAATDLYGAGSPEVISVGQAWSAVGVI